MPLIGSFAPPGDKSISHRIVLMALLAKGFCRVANLSACDDVRSSLAIYRALGGTAHEEGQVVSLTGMEGRVHMEPPVLDCGNSGTTMRLLCGILAGLKGNFVLDGDTMLRKRPMARVTAPLVAMGADITCTDDKAPVYIKGSGLKGIDYVSPVASAQVKSALLLAGLNASGPTLYQEPHSSRDHSEIMLRQFGAQLANENKKLVLRPGGLELPPEFNVPGDASSAAFFLSAAAFIPGSRVSAGNMSLNPTRTGFLTILKRMGAGVETAADNNGHEACGLARVFYNGPLNGVEVEAGEVPSLIDEIPILALAASQARGTSVFKGVEELTVKEINRLTALREQLSLLGADIEVKDNNLIISGREGFALQKDSLVLNSGHDHRMVMTLALATKACGREFAIKGAEAVSVSYPGFWDDLESLWREN